MTIQMGNGTLKSQQSLCNQIDHQTISASSSASQQLDQVII